MEATTLSLAKSALDSVLSKAADVIGSEISLLVGVRSQLSFIKDEMEMMHAFLRAAAAGREDRNEVVRTWVKQVQDLAYNVEDCFDRLAVHLKNDSWLKLPSAFSRRHQIAMEIQVIKSKVEEVSQRNLRYRLIGDTSSVMGPAGSSNDLFLPDHTVVAAHEAEYVGQEKQRIELRRLVCSDRQHFRVLAVWGMGGLGKTTLVKDVYNSVDGFRCRIWATLLHPFSLSEFLRDLAKQIFVDASNKDGEAVDTMKRLSKMPQDALLVLVCSHLLEKKYLLVLDDISEEQEWDSIVTCLPRNSYGSSIIVTTRVNKIARYCCQSEPNYHVIELNVLEDEDAYKLFCSKVHKSSNFKAPLEGRYTGESSEALVPAHNGLNIIGDNRWRTMGKKEGGTKEEVEEVQKKIELNPADQHGLHLPLAALEDRKIILQILERCGGLPLAITAVGGFLATKPIAQWNNLLDCLDTEVASNWKLDKALAVLSSSYEGLPYHLKSCFLYMSIFPRNKEIKKTLLVRRWIAEGFVKGRRGVTEEELGEHYFTELISRSMIQPSRTASLINGSFNSCQVHDMMLTISMSKSTEENLVCFLDKHNFPSKQDTVRHLIVTDGWDRAQNDRAMRSMNVAHNRSLVVYGEWSSSFLSPKMVLLRVLDLEGTKGLEDNDLENIGSFRHLNYLGLRGTNITRLPKSLSKLVNLQTLDIRSTWVTQLTSGIIKLQHLRYVRAARPYKIRYQTFFTVSGSGLCFQHRERSFIEVLVSREMPATTRSRIRRKNMDPFGVQVPSRIGSLGALHTLGVIDVGSSKGIARQLRRLTQLRKLGLAGLGHQNVREIIDSVAQLQHLQSLALKSRKQDAELDMLSELSEISSTATLLSVKFFARPRGLPRWVAALRNLAKLHLRDTRFNQRNLEELSCLPSLTVLLLLKNSFNKIDLCFQPESFSKLKTLVLVQVKLKSLAFEQDSSRQMEQLAIVFPKERYEVNGVEYLQWLKNFDQRDVSHGLDPQDEGHIEGDYESD